MEGREAESCKGRSTSFQAHGRVRVQQWQHSRFWCTQVHSYPRPHLWPQGGVGWDRVGRGGVEWVLLEVHAQRIMGHSFKDRVCYIICRAQSIKKKKGKNVGTLVQTSKKVKDTKAKSIKAFLLGAAGMCPIRHKVRGRERSLQGSSSPWGCPGGPVCPFPLSILLLGFLLILGNVTYSDQASLEKSKPI